MTTLFTTVSPAAAAGTASNAPITPPMAAPANGEVITNAPATVRAIIGGGSTTLGGVFKRFPSG